MEEGKDIFFATVINGWEGGELKQREDLGMDDRDADLSKAGSHLGEKGKPVLCHLDRLSHTDFGDFDVSTDSGYSGKTEIGKTSSLTRRSPNGKRKVGRPLGSEKRKKE